MSINKNLKNKEMVQNEFNDVVIILTRILNFKNVSNLVTKLQEVYGVFWLIG